MKNDEAVKALKEYQLWRRGKPPYSFGQLVDMPFTPEELGQALDIAIAVLERPADHIAGASNMVQEKVQNTDSVEGITPFDAIKRKNAAELEASTLHARVKILELDNEKLRNDFEYRGGMLAIAALDDSGAGCLRAILRELLTLKWHKDTFGKTPEYLERMPKAWEAAKEAVK